MGKVGCGVRIEHAADARLGARSEPVPPLDSPDLRDAIQAHARTQGTKIFLRSVDENREVTFGELAQYCAAISGYLAGRGVATKDKISVVGRNSVETLLAYLGVLYHGSVVNPINADESRGNIGKILGIVRPRMLLHDEDLDIDTMRLGIKEVIAFNCRNVPLAKCNDFFSALLMQKRKESARCIRSSDLSEIVFTSGTTSTPKGVCIARGPLHAMVAEVVEKLGITGDDVLLEYRNYNWASAQLLTILSSVLTGATLVLAQRFSRSRFPEWLTEHGVTVAAGVPTVINILVQEPVHFTKGEPVRLRFLTSSSAPLSVARQLAFEEAYGIPILQMAGMTEAGFMLGNPPDGRKIGSAGTACRHKEVFFLNSAGRRCAQNEEGEMIVRGYSMGLGYLQPTGEIEPFSPEGFRTGDLGYMDDDGFVYITGRVKDLIIRGGVNIAPAEITARLMEHPTVRDAATIGVPDGIYGEEVVSFVVLKKDALVDTQEIMDHCLRNLPSFKVPKRLLFLDSIPKTTRGKISKNDLLRLLGTLDTFPGPARPSNN